ncbi:hypothetical protein LPJ61_000175 [Coemansia biformis]|uniref:Derlin n=1 Tax=Coemansia biformis TaxID=1286918 RepID=A0A9W8D1W6_9FUNG|nr:hypothetical protein LPJ61_000175 [Coemansia biformis]
MARQAAGTRGLSSDGAQIAQWYQSLPTCTRFLLAATVTVTLLCGFQVVGPYRVALYWPLVIKQFQVWRLATTFMFTSTSLNGLIHVIMLYRHSLALETEEYVGRTADYAWFLLFCAVAMLSVSWVTATTVLSDGLLLALVTLWSLHRAEQIVSFFLGIRFPARYLPYALMGLDFVLGGGIPYGMFYGWGAAQAYYYLSVDLPAQGGLNYIPTPQLVYRLVGQARRADPRTVSSGFASSSNPIHQRPGGGHSWGQGRRLA